jgi:hypothetical protein
VLGDPGGDGARAGGSRRGSPRCSARTRSIAPRSERTARSCWRSCSAQGDQERLDVPLGLRDVLEERPVHCAIALPRAAHVPHRLEDSGVSSAAMRYSISTRIGPWPGSGSTANCGSTQWAGVRSTCSATASRSPDSDATRCRASMPPPATRRAVETPALAASAPQSAAPAAIPAWKVRRYRARAAPPRRRRLTGSLSSLNAPRSDPMLDLRHRVLSPPDPTRTGAAGVGGSPCARPTSVNRVALGVPRPQEPTTARYEIWPTSRSCGTSSPEQRRP